MQPAILKPPVFDICDSVAYCVGEVVAFGYVQMFAELFITP